MAQRRHSRAAVVQNAPPPVEGVFLDGVVAPLAEKARDMMRACPGSHLLSGVRRTYVAGTRRVSLHASGRAVDIAGPSYACIYARLAGWPGGYSTDPGAARHVHVSYDPWGRQEWGARFAHGGGGHRHHARRGGAQARGDYDVDF